MKFQNKPIPLSMNEWSEEQNAHFLSSQIKVLFHTDQVGYQTNK